MKTCHSSVQQIESKLTQRGLVLDSCTDNKENEGLPLVLWTQLYKNL